MRRLVDRKPWAPFCWVDDTAPLPRVYPAYLFQRTQVIDAIKQTTVALARMLGREP